MKRRAMITGVGSVCGFGLGLAALQQGLQAGACAIKPIRAFDASSFPLQFAGEVANELNPGPIDASWLSVHGLQDHPIIMQPKLWQDRKTVFGLLAARQAWQMAGCTSKERRASLLVALGLEQAYLQDFAPLLHDHQINIGQLDWRCSVLDASPKIKQPQFRAEVDLCAQLIETDLQLQGPRMVNASACAAGGLALAQAASWIERGAADIVLCGGADSMLNPFGLGGMARLGAPSPRNAPDACRPFDSQRDGLVIGEGAAMFVLEEAQHAQARGVPALAEILGYASNQDAYRVTAPRADGAQTCRAMQAALRKARLSAAQIGYINAHGTGTVLNDIAEARAIHACFGEDAPAVSSIKGALGHLMAASGAIEAAACVLSLQHAFLPGTAHFARADAECQLDIIGPTPRAQSVDYILSNSFGFGGQNVSLIFGRVG